MISKDVCDLNLAVFLDAAWMYTKRKKIKRRSGTQPSNAYMSYIIFHHPTNFSCETSVGIPFKLACLFCLCPMLHLWQVLKWIWSSADSFTAMGWGYTTSFSKVFQNVLPLGRTTPSYGFHPKTCTVNLPYVLPPPNGSVEMKWHGGGASINGQQKHV